jgi:putative mycofactocin binding protein MftB
VVYRLADRVQVRRESWGLLFYSSDRHKLRFVRSGEWLEPHHFDGTWTLSRLAENIAGHSNKPVEVIQPSVQKLLDRLVEGGLIVNELC